MAGYKSSQEVLAFLRERPDFRKVEAEYTAYKAGRTIPDFDPPVIDIEEGVRKLDGLPGFDIGRGIEDFFREIGIIRGISMSQPNGLELDNQQPQAEEEDSDRKITWDDTLIPRQDLELLASALPERERLAIPISLYTSSSQDTPVQYKARIQDTVARLALQPAFTLPIAQIFSRIIVDISARWLILLGYDGRQFPAGSPADNDVAKHQLLAVLAAFARLLKRFPHIYPCLIVVMQHPLLRTESPLDLLPPFPAGFTPPAWPSSALSPSPDLPPTFYHSSLPVLLLTFLALLEAVPFLSQLPIQREYYGSPLAPPELHTILRSHPLASTRLLAWHIICRWTGLGTGPKAGQLRKEFVYDPVRDPAGGLLAGVEQTCPAPNFDRPKGQGEEWLEYWPRLGGKAKMSEKTGRLEIKLQTPLVDAWVYEEKVTDLEKAAWLLPPSAARPLPITEVQESDMQLDNTNAEPRLSFEGEDLSPLVVDVHGIHTLRESCLPDSSSPAALTLSSSSTSQAPSDARARQVPVFISTSPAVQALRQLVLHAAARVPVLLSSPSSAGKSTVLDELHRQLYASPGQAGSVASRDKQIVTINLADRSLDAKTLLGSLSSSPTEPGTFVFVEGTLTRAIRHGRWLVLEDVDRAADDVLCTVAELVERIKQRAQSAVGGGWGGASSSITGTGSFQDGVGVLAGGRWVPAAEGFMLFATRSVQSSAAAAERDIASRSPTFFGAQYWSNVWLPLPTIDEIRQIIFGRFPKLHEAVAGKLVEVWDAVRTAANAVSGPSTGAGMSRDVGIRDLVKWCERAQHALPRDLEITHITQNPIFQEEIFIEARDVFLGAFPTSSLAGRSASSKYLAIVAALQEGLSLSAERVDWILTGRTPEVILPSSDTESSGTAQFGRARLQKLVKRKAVTGESGRKHPYALTKPFLSLLERLAVCAQLAEPVLMVGETGTGKTAAVGHLASTLGRNLVALNLSNQTEASDLLGGFKPVNEAEEIERIALQLVNDFVELFSRTFSMARNAEYTAAVTKAYKKKKWLRLVGLWREAGRMASDRVAVLKAAALASVEDSPRKKRKVSANDLGSAWQAFLEGVSEFEARQNQQGTKAAKFAFNFVEGPLVRAIQRGDWVLLDEVNLATSETLGSLSTLLQASDASLVLTERGDLEPVRRHPDFRLFACMNPATDVGKRDLPPALRTRFTEIYVPPPDADKDALLSIVQGYIGYAAVGDRGIVLDVADFYLAIKLLSAAGKLADGTNQPPHFSMRTLARALTFAADLAPTLGIRRAVYEGCLMTFTTLLEGSSADTVMELLQAHFVNKAKNPRSFLSMPHAKPEKPSDFVHVGAYWLERGSEAAASNEHYVLTPSVQTKLVNLARTVAIRRFPVLIQGPTSSGKTSIIEYLARQTGHRFVRINNHEHTDIQEYLGTYVSDPKTGKLVFREGILVKAVRNGDWIVLDELNLAPTDVLEALNRLLDDNRELVIPETQEVVKPHSHFMLFATQNPPGLYGGRKVLSRAFRNRFLEMHFTDVPKDELETILCERCQIAPSYAKKIVAVFVELQKRRQSTRVFEEKQAFVTLRDLFRWGGREAVGYEQLATDGYMLLAERARKPEDKQVVREVIETVMKVKLDERAIYDSVFASLTRGIALSSELVWTNAMRRLFVLVHSALKHNEPVLLVGETGSGKTSVCQSIAEVLGCSIHILNCHQNTETADLIGSQRPVRNRANMQDALRAEAQTLLFTHGSIIAPEYDYEDVMLLLKQLSSSTAEASDLYKRMQEASALFTWYDGPLVQAMKQGDIVLLDEISLADDSVLERLNSVLEPGRTLVIAEKGAEDLNDVKIRGHERFQVLATMNPGGDYGKKELSPALRNRFTEIWVPWVTDHQDLLDIINGRWQAPQMQAFTQPILDFAEWFTRALRPREAPVLGTAVTLRDLLAWVAFMNAHRGKPGEGFVHGALMTLVDAIGTTPATSSLSPTSIESIKRTSLIELDRLAIIAGSPYSSDQIISDCFATDTHLAIPPFTLAKGAAAPTPSAAFSLQAPTTLQNAQKVMRAMQLTKPVLLEGSPGVGKTSLITALAALANYRLCRINLSDQTDLIDLFGSDLPVEGGKSGEFAWRDAPFLAAMQAGDWVLLDEMNLASQSVLEGLNSCLDHRGSVYIPELDRSFTRHPDFRIFAAQNPSNQGGSRKGLPRSFVDRFTQVYMVEPGRADYTAICKSMNPVVSNDIIDSMVNFVSQLNQLLSTTRFGQQGSPWELNLRDLLRWFGFLQSPTGLERYPQDPAEYLDVLFLQRFRTAADRILVLQAFQSAFNKQVSVSSPGLPLVTYHTTRIGRTIASNTNTLRSIPHQEVRADQYRLRSLQALAAALDFNYLAIVTGPSASGKTSLVHEYATMTGKSMRSFYMNPQTDTLEMLGTFEQANLVRSRLATIEALQASLLSDSLQGLSDENSCHVMLKHIYLLRRKIGADAAAWSSAVTDFSQVVASCRMDATYKAFLSDLDGASGSSAGRFEWLDGPLVQAMQSGDIFLIENANLCNASVLDRLNALFEPGGKLQLTERGMVNNSIVTIAAHPDFRVVMTLDPKYGELSRAMRNRGVELALQASPVAMLPRNPVFAIQAPLLAASNASRLSLQISLETGSADLRFNPLELEYAFLSSTPSALHRNARISGTSSSLLLGNQPLLPQVARQRQSLSGNCAIHAPLALALDSNDGRRALPDNQRKQSLALDALLKVVFPALLLQRESAGLLSASLQSTSNQLSILQQSCIANTYPARLPRLADGVIHVFPLLQALLAAVAGLANSATSLETLMSHASLASAIVDTTHELHHVASSRALDYATYELLLDWLSQSLTSSPLDQLGEVVRVLTHARVSVKRTSGHFYEAIWRSFLPAKSSASIAPLMRVLQSVAAQTNVSSLPSDLAKLSIEVMAQTSSSMQDSDGHGIQTLLRSLTQRLQVHCEADPEETVYTDTWITATIAELQTVSASGPTEAATQQAFLRSCLRERRSLMSLVPAFSPFSQDSSGLEALSNWLRHAAFPSEQAMSGLNSLLTPGLLYDGQAIRSMCLQLPLKDFADAMGQVHRAGSMHFELAAVTTSTRYIDLAKILAGLVTGLVSAIAEQLPTPLASTVNHALHGAIDMLKSAQAVDSTIAASSSLAALQSAITSLVSSHEGGNRFLPDLAASYMSWATAFWDLFLPNIAVDPAVASRAKEAALGRKKDRLLTASALQSGRIESIRDFGSIELDLLAQQIVQLDEALVELEGADIERASDVELVNALFSELHQAGNTIFSNISAMSLSGTVVQTHANISARLQNLRDTLKSLASRLSRAYSLYSDILKPVLMCLGALSIGIELWIFVLGSQVVGSALQKHTVALSNLVTFPTIASAQQIAQQSLPTASRIDQSATISHAQAVRLRLEALARLVAVSNAGDAECQLASTVRKAIRKSYDQMHGLWSDDRAKEAEEKAEAESIYKSRRTEVAVPDDEELEASEMARLFPTDDAASGVDSNAPAGKRHLMESDIIAIAEVHSQIFGRSGGTSATGISIKNDVVFNVQRAYSLHLAADLDNVSTAFRLDLLHDATQQSSVAVVGADFYLDSQPAQIRKMHDPILAMQKRASELAEEWPEQMILVEISERCEALLQLPVVTPIARVLTYLESFLPKIEDWERYSSSQTTLRPLQSNIVALIVEWRRLELSSWARLLDREEQQYAQRMADWWFRFYETLIRSAITLESDASTTQSTSTFLNNIVGVLQTFFDSSPVGHFSRRLDLVRSFARLASEMSNEGYPLLSRISALLYNIFEFYRRKGQEIIAYLGTERKRLAKDLQDVIRLASWRDVNVDALKASAQKSHRQLYKTIRKFRAILDKPAQPFLTASNSASVDNKDDTQSIIHTKAPASLLVPVNETPSDLPSGTPSAIIHLDQTIKRLNSVLAEKETSTSSSPGQAVDDLRSIIIQRSSALRDEQPKGATKEEKAKYVNALTNRKRKAWSDLLKELKRIGLSPRPSERTLSKQTDSTNLYGSPPLLYRAKDSFLPMEHLEGADALFYGILSRFPAIRGVPANHHDDISSAQFLSAVGSLQSSFAVVLDDRSRLERTMFRFSRLQQRSHFLEEFANIGLASSQQQDSASTLHELLQRNRKLADALSEVIAASSRHRSLMDDKNDHASVEHLGRALAQALNNMNESNHDLQRLYESASATSLLSKSDEAAVGKAEVLWQSSSDLLKQLVRLMPRLAYLLEPVDQWMTAQVLPQKLYTVSAVASAEEEYVKLVSSILNVFQAVSGRPEVPVLGDDGDISDLAVSKASKHLRETVAALYLEEVDEQMSRFCRACAQADAYQREALISRGQVIVQAYLILARQHLGDYFAWHRAQLKLCHTLVGLVLTLAQEGFCKPQESDTQSGGQTETGSGTGMGAGKGDNNVSNEIEGEEQVEGLQDEADDENEEPEQDKKGKDDAVDMSDDFGGRMEDVPSDEEDENDDKKEDEQEGEEEEDPYDQIGQVDPLDPGAVDDKFWGGDNKEDEDDDEMKEETGQQPQETGDSEMGERKEGKQPEKKPDQADEQTEDSGAEMPEDDIQGDAADEDTAAEAGEELPEEDGQAEQQNRDQMPEMDMDAQALDLPEDLQLDAQPEDKDGLAEDEDLYMDTADADNNEPLDADSGDEQQDAEGENKEVEAEAKDTTEGEKESEVQDEQAMEHASGAEAGAQGGESASSSSLRPEAMPDVADQEDQTEAGEADMQTDADAGQPGKESAGRGQHKQQKSQPSQATKDEAPVQDDSQAQKPESSKEQVGAEADNAEEAAEAAASASAERNLGDAAKEWMRRLEAIQDATEDGPSEDQAKEAAEDAELEYADDAGRDVEMQAAGAADDEQAQQTSRQADDNQIVDNFQALEVDEVAEGALQNRMDAHQIPGLQEDQEISDLPDIEMGSGGLKDNLDHPEQDLPPRQPSPDPQLEEQAISQQLQHWYEDGRTALPPDEVWRLYETLTRDLSFSLTESLRLVLEPTLATRLKGDYRTGKRLNMKKIIPYIASDFTKDKIWLRRTRPSAREYQILLAVDDSRSMSDGRAVHLAYQTLALVTQSLTRLEAGQVSVARFGETVDFVHEFDDGPVSDTAGSKIIEAFTFAQRSTDVRRLLEKSLQRLAEARESKRGSAADLWQMEIIISDGICQDMEDLRALLRKATEQKVMVVFIVVDSLHQQASTSGTSTPTADKKASSNKNSILSMNSVSYVRGKDGSLELKMERYLDQFPFDYYMVLRDVQALPDVLSETLRQFFERVQGDR